MQHRWIIFLFVTLFSIPCFHNSSCAQEFPDIRIEEPDLKVPECIDGEPAPGKRVKQVLEKYAGTEIYHAVYLPTDWSQDKKFPVIIEYAGNGPYKNKYGDISTGEVDGCQLGYGISGGKGFVWVSLPYIAKNHQENQKQWFGDLEATVEYCKTIVPQIYEKYHGDPEKVILAGFSRGSIACNVIGLYDDEIAKLWAGFICHSHYHGPRKWGFPGSDRETAKKCLERLNGRPQFISHERSVKETQNYLQEVMPDGPFTFLSLPYRNHTAAWTLCDIPARKAVREWLQKVVEK